jgi:hypothetical protein
MVGQRKDGLTDKEIGGKWVKGRGRGEWGCERYKEERTKKEKV